MPSRIPATSKRLRSPRTRSRARCTTCRQAASLRSTTAAISRVADVEHVVQQKRGALFRRQPLEQREERDGEIVGQLEVTVGWIVGHDRFREPGADVGLAFGLEPPQPIDRQPGRRGDEPGLGILDRLVRRLVPSDVRLLNDVFGVGARAEHAIGQPEQPSAQSFERNHRLVAGAHPSHSLLPRRASPPVVTGDRHRGRATGDWGTVPAEPGLLSGLS